MSQACDVAVIGAGVFGAWTAYRLASSGARVVLLDQHGPGNSRSSSGDETRIIRMSYGADEIYTRAAMRSLELWKQLVEATGRPLFHQSGVLVTAARSDPHLLSSRDTLTRVGARFEWLESAPLRGRFPNIVFDRQTAAIWEPESGVLMARRSVQTVVEAAVRKGVRYENLRAIGLKKPYVMATNAGDVEARTFVFACGPWLPKLFPKFLRGRIRPTRQEVFFFGAPAADLRFALQQMPAWIAFRDGAYSVPAVDGRGFKLAMDRHGPPFDPEMGQRTMTPERLKETRKILRKRFPDLSDAPLVEFRVCQYENTSNGDFLIDRHPEFENVWLAGGGSGHGFKHGPFVGEYVAARIAGKGSAEPRFLLKTKKVRANRSVY